MVLVRLYAAVEKRHINESLQYVENVLKYTTTKRALSYNLTLTTP